jgi:hypothetical protein
MSLTTTVSTGSGLLRVELTDRGASWMARLVDPGPRYSLVPAALHTGRDGALATLQAAVRAVDVEPAPRAVGPASSWLCP